jgi:hypothetical protein
MKKSETLSAWEDKTYGCDDCKYLVSGYCKMWQKRIADPHDSHCEIVLSEYGRKAQTNLAGKE